MRVATLFHIHRDGWVVLLAVAVLGWLIQRYGPLWAALPVFAAMAPLALMFYEPDHRLSSSPLGVVAPVDGVVIDSAPCRDPYLDRDAVRVRLKVRQFGGYFIRAAIEGKLLGMKSSDAVDTSHVSWIQSDEQDDVVVSVPSGAMFGLKPCAGCIGERVGQGRKCGLRRLARQVDVYMPSTTRVQVAAGDRVEAGTDVLATLVHDSRNTATGVFAAGTLGA